jgi:molybdopterin synthase catalytic subunit
VIVGFLTTQPIRLDTLVAQVTAPERGGVATFLGLVRDHHDGRSVTGLDYSAYEPMAEAVCRELIAEVEAMWPVRAALSHRLGRLDIGDAAVAIVVAGHHRDEAFAACRHLIEELKRRVPIWKRETYADGTVMWVDPTNQGAGSREQGAGRPA